MLPQADDCPFCEEEMKWRKDKWIHPGQNGCIMIGIGIETKRQVRLWNTRGGVAPENLDDDDLFMDYIKTTANGAVAPPPPPPPAPPTFPTSGLKNVLKPSEPQDWLGRFNEYHKRKNHAPD